MTSIKATSSKLNQDYSDKDVPLSLAAPERREGVVRDARGLGGVAGQVSEGGPHVPDVPRGGHTGGASRALCYTCNCTSGWRREAAEYTTGTRSFIIL